MVLRRRCTPAKGVTIALLLVVSSSGCTAASDTPAVTGAPSSSPSAASVSGEAMLPPGADVPSIARLEVSLQDVSVDDRGEVSTVTIPLGGLIAPYSWRIVYDPSTVDAQGSYTVSARILEGSKARFTTASPMPVITGANPTDGVRLTLVAT